MLPRIQIIYASASGNVEAVATKMFELLQPVSAEVRIVRAEFANHQHLIENDHFIFATSTWEHGAINPYFKPLLEEMKTTLLKGKKAGFVGLGDTRYEPVLFCEGIEILKRKFEAAGGTPVYNTLKINGNPYPLLETIVKDWTVGFINSLKQHEK